MTLTNQQKTIIDEWINTSRYVYNKTINLINNGHPIDHFQLRDKLVTENTKKNNKMAEFYPFFNFFSFCAKKLFIMCLIIVDKMYFSTAVGGLKYIQSND